MKHLLFICFSLTVAVLSLAQNKTISADSAIATFRALYPQEKVFVQSDKDFYFPGETMYMKAWCTLENAPTFLSRIVYIDLVDPSGQVILKHMYRLDSLGSTGADFDIPDDIASGNYSINGYSLWMLNFPEYVFRKNIFIYGKDYKSQNAAKTASTAAFSVKFYPEGGNIISGVTNRIAFKATDSNGLPASIRGEVTDRSGKKVAVINTEHDGMGSFELDAEPNNEYTAVATRSSLSSGPVSAKLPAAQSEGIAFRIENTNPGKLFVLLNRAEYNKQNYAKVKVVATINYQLVFSQELNLDNGENACVISKKNLPAGILHITLFNKDNLPLAERLAFVENYIVVRPEILMEQKDLKPKSKNQLSFNLPGSVPSSVSLSITSYAAADSLVLFKENIASSLLATSDLKGYIHNSGYYFKDKNAGTLHALDLLLMTQGWSRYDWKKLQDNDFVALKYPVESAITFTGFVSKSDSKDPVTDGKVSFIIKSVDSTSILGEARLTDKGTFLLSNINYPKSAIVSYMGTSTKKENTIVDVHLRPNYIDSLKQSIYAPQVNLDTAMAGQQSIAARILNKNITELENIRTKTLQTVIVKSRRLTPLDSLNKHYAGGPFLLGKGIDPAEYKNVRTIWQMIQMAVPGVSVEGNPFDPTVTFSRFAAFGGGSSSTNVSESSDGSLSQSVLLETGGIAYFLNEVNVTKDIINTLNVDDVGLIKVLKNEGAVLGASQGAIVIYTKTDVAASGWIYDKRYTSQKLAGYSISKDYYTPAVDPASVEEDNRYTLYWNAQPVKAKDGNYRFRFFNNSIGTKLRIIIQGIDKNGQLILGEKIIE